MRALTLSSSGSYINAEIDHYGIGPQAGWLGLHYCGSADAELMSAHAGPGRTGFIFDSERLVPGLARTATASIFYRGCCVTRVSNMDSPPPSAVLAHMGSQDDSGHQRGGEWLDHSGLDCDHDPLLVN